MSAPGSRIPQHIAIIMDGNGRWAQARGLPRVKGHEEGANSVREIGRARRFLSGLEAELLAEAVTADGNTSGAEQLAGDGKTSRRETRRRAKRGKANAASGGKLADRMI